MKDTIGREKSQIQVPQAEGCVGGVAPREVDSARSVAQNLCAGSQKGSPAVPVAGSSVRAGLAWPDIRSEGFGDGIRTRAHEPSGHQRSSSFLGGIIVEPQASLSPVEGIMGFQGFHSLPARAGLLVWNVGYHTLILRFLTPSQQSSE